MSEPLSFAALQRLAWEEEGGAARRASRLRSVIPAVQNYTAAVIVVGRHYSAIFSQLAIVP